MGRKMSEVVKNIKVPSNERIAIQNMIDSGKDPVSDATKRYFFNKPPYQYTALEPKSWGTRIVPKGDTT